MEEVNSLDHGTNLVVFAVSAGFTTIRNQVAGVLCFLAFNRKGKWLQQ